MNEHNSIDYVVHESAMARMERANKRLFILCIMVFIAFVSTNIGWIIYESNVEKVTTTIEAEQDGDAVNIVGGGDISYGAESKDH